GRRGRRRSPRAGSRRAGAHRSGAPPRRGGASARQGRRGARAGRVATGGGAGGGRPRRPAGGVPGRRGDAGAAANDGSAAPYVPDSRSLRVLAAASKRCRGCPLWKDATQTVFGSGKRSAPLVLVGEQPGDREDVRGRPFVGPAGRVLWQCLEEAGVASSDV